MLKLKVEVGMTNAMLRFSICRGENLSNSQPMMSPIVMGEQSKKCHSVAFDQSEIFRQHHNHTTTVAHIISPHDVILQII